MKALANPILPLGLLVAVGVGAATDPFGSLTPAEKALLKSQIPGADIAWVDRLDSATKAGQFAPGTHQQANEPEEERPEVLENIWLPPRDSNPDMLIQSQLSCR